MSNDVRLPALADLPDGWSVPAIPAGGKNTGFVWLGTRPATDEDIAELKDVLGPQVPIDEDTLCGVADPRYESGKANKRNTSYAFR